ncbi:MAG TPA: hypothetical protein VH542_00450 [Steroidobacteraceae bacterium]
MKTHVRTISLALAATALISGQLLGAPLTTASSDAQAQAAALLSRDWMPVAHDAHMAAATRIDGHSRAAALLSGSPTEGPASRLSGTAPADGQASAAALLSRGTI